MTHLLLGGSSLLALVSYIVYIRAIFQGRAKPHRTTRFILALITITATWSLIAQGSSGAVWLSGAFAIGCLAVFVLSLKYGMGGWTKVDLGCLIISVLGIFIWQLTTNPLFGLFSSILADLFGQIPMLIKTYKFPKTEVWTFYFLDILASVLNLLAISNWTIGESTYPLYIIFIDSLTVFLIIRPV